MIKSQFVAAIAVSTTLAAAQAQPPADLAARLAVARIDGTLAIWCEGQFEMRRPRGYAIAVRSASAGGRYLVVDDAATITELAAFKGAPDLACYTPDEARKLNQSIRSSETIRGRIAPLFPTTIVCGFVENTDAVCWQYSPKTRSFVKVGEWQT